MYKYIYSNFLHINLKLNLFKNIDIYTTIDEYVS